MRLPRVRFALRWMMIAVAVVALVMAAERLVKWRAHLLRRAEVDADRATDWANYSFCLRPEYNKPGMYEKMRDYWLASARKYRLAADRPWLPVEPDAPQPE
jgi:hypothetical protein